MKKSLFQSFASPSLLTLDRWDTISLQWKYFLFGRLAKYVPAAVGLVCSSPESCRQMTLSTCAPPPWHTTPTSRWGATFKSLNIKRANKSASSSATKARSMGPGMTPLRSENRWHSQRPQEDRVALRKWCQAGLAKKSTLAALDARRRCLFAEKRLGFHAKIQRSRLTRSNLKRDLSSSLSWIKRQVAYQELVPLIKWRRRWGHRGMKYKHKKKHFSCCFFCRLKAMIHQEMCNCRLHVSIACLFCNMPTVLHSLSSLFSAAMAALY